jgi:hypothetical protein
MWPFKKNMRGFRPQDDELRDELLPSADEKN